MTWETPHDQVGDHDLMARVAGGDETAFEELVKRHQQRVVDYLFRLLRDRARSEELAQEVFIRIFSHRNAYSRDAEFRTWCYAIATNLARDEHRAFMRRPARVGADVMESVQRDGSDPSSQIETDELRSKVMSALEQIPEHLRVPLTLRDLQGCSYQEISTVLRMELGTVKSRINRARLAFKDVFLGLGGEGE